MGNVATFYPRLSINVSEKEVLFAFFFVAIYEFNDRFLTHTVIAFKRLVNPRIVREVFHVPIGFQHGVGLVPEHSHANFRDFRLALLQDFDHFLDRLTRVDHIVNEQHTTF